MGREIRRVPLTFDWPLNKPWEGFVNPYYRKCPSCSGSGSTLAHEWLSAVVAELMLLAGDATTQQTHPYFRHFRYPVRPPTRDYIQLTTGLAGRGPMMSLIGHDCIDHVRACTKIKKAAGLKKSWGMCEYCAGSGVDPTFYKAYSRWRPRKPPKGRGYQLWETVSEGSPISPVFKTADELARWCVNGRHGTATYDEWLRFINGPGWAPSFVSTPKDGIVDGVKAAATILTKEE